MEEQVLLLLPGQWSTLPPITFPYRSADFSLPTSTVCFYSHFLQPSLITGATQPVTFPYTTFHFLFYDFLLSHATPPHSLSCPFILLPGAPSGSCHNRRWNGFICSNVVWAAAWHGTERHFILPHRASLPHRLQFMCFQTGQSTPLSCVGLYLRLPPTLTALSVSVKATSHLSHTPLSLMANSYSKLLSFCLYLPPVHSNLSVFSFFIHFQTLFAIISMSFCLVSAYVVGSPNLLHH